jgi:succinate-semialdehyde dehydrogenase/glutarate-semialdehyde dehydrogenase
MRSVTSLVDVRRRRAAAARAGAITSVNPTTGLTLRSYEPFTDEQVEDRLGRAVVAYEILRRTPISTRAAVMIRLAELLEGEREALGRLITAEMGKLLRAAIEEVVKCARACRHYAEHARALLADEAVATEASSSFVRYEPLGPILAVMPWNFPFWQVFRFAAPAVMAGNVVLLKHAASVPQCALAIEDLFLRAGFREGVFQTLLLRGERALSLLDDDRVVAATLTGSEAAGAAVASRAGEKVKKTVLELGGSDPFIVMPSAEVERAVATAVTARVINNGQSCIAAKRFIVADSVYGRFELRLVRRMRALKVGDPMEADTDVGPLASDDAVQTLDGQVRRSLDAGARLLTGGRRMPGHGFFYEPTVLAEVPEEAPAFHEEMFGPVAALLRARDADEAIRLANATSFGLGASVWTNDAGERARFVDELETGLVFVNAMVVSDPRLPFGGTKRSGYGRELGAWGIREFVNVKTVWIADGASPPHRIE